MSQLDTNSAPTWKRRVARLMGRSGASPDTPTVHDVHSAHPAIHTLSTLASKPDAASLAVQSMAVQGLRATERILALERRVADATLSLAQQTYLAEMTVTLQAAAQALRTLIGRQGEQLLAFAEAPQPSQAEAPSWWGRLDAAIEALEGEADRLTAVACGQPIGGSIRTLSETLGTLFRGHADVLRHERTLHAA
ncbi:MAG: hypothetical protein AAF970_19280 [Bacteroidota bacterium]